MPSPFGSHANPARGAKCIQAASCFGRSDVRNSRIAWKQYPGRSILVDGASKTLIEPLLVELRRYGAVIVRPYERFPSHTAVQRKPGGGFPCVLHIETDVILAKVLCRNLILPPFI